MHKYYKSVNIQCHIKKKKKMFMITIVFIVCGYPWRRSLANVQNVKKKKNIS